MRLCTQAVLYIDTRKIAERMAFSKAISTISSRENIIPRELKLWSYMWDRNLPAARQPKRPMDLYAQSRSQLDAWKISFDNFMRGQSHTFGSKQLRGAALFQIHRTTVHVKARISEPDLDDTRSINNSYNGPKKVVAFEPEFQDIIRLARSLTNAAEEDAKAGKPPFTFSIDLGLLAPLYCMPLYSSNYHLTLTWFYE
ncbi:hypothetical protein DSL72_007761 [Monilinia vaccinii-corymbosi]|uniref:Uncharacterized protein n=1 Tax=Monilinia vaccinii-corymbosi TaxID=61207 RepID=A0A8A3PIJ4_9HELO|nr:hypothetical protein DSL72_007761 [Monilinia vaccinii-corymbosi]